MQNDDLLSRIKGVRITKPSDHVIKQFRNLMNSNVIKPGEILPSERDLANSFGIGKGYVREALKKMEMYGVVKSVPGVGTIVSDLGKGCVQDFINNFVQFSMHDYHELVEVRMLVEPFMASRAAVNATDDELRAIGETVEKLGAITANDGVDLRLECNLHLEIAKASHNSILASTMIAILPGLIELMDELDLIRDGRHRISHEEHKALYAALGKRDPFAAEQAMRHHMQQMGGHFTVSVGHIEEKRVSQRRAAR